MLYPFEYEYYVLIYIPKKSLKSVTYSITSKCIGIANTSYLIVIRTKIIYDSKYKKTIVKALKNFGPKQSTSN